MKHEGSNTSRSPFALLLLAAFGAGTAGGLVANGIEGADSAGADVSAPASDDADLSRLSAELGALATAIDALARRPAPVAAPGDPAVPRGPEPLRPDASAELEAALTRLADTLAAAGSQRPAVADRDSLRLPDDAPGARAKLLALRGKDLSAVRREHLLLTTGQIVERYGIPDRIGVDGPIVYLVWKDTDDKELSFRTYDGIVVGAELPR